MSIRATQEKPLRKLRQSMASSWRWSSIPNPCPLSGRPLPGAFLTETIKYLSALLSGNVVFIEPRCS
jgi:hypothetical protein